MQQKKIIPIKNFEKKEKTITGALSYQSKKNLNNCIQWLCYLSTARNIKYNDNRILKNFRISFVTLTLPSQQVHSHQEIKERCLNLFFTQLRKKHKVKNYIWKAELQQNGNIHFHVTLDKFIHYMALRQEWNSAINVLGYVDRYQAKFLNLNYEQYEKSQRNIGRTDSKKIRDSYNFGIQSKWKNPNTTDVKKVQNVKNLAAYLSKYISKGLVKKDASKKEKESLKTFSGRFWYCSNSISRLKSVKLPTSPSNLRVFYRLKELKKNYVIEFDFCKTIYFGNCKIPPDIIEWLRQELFSHAIKMNYPFA